MKGDLRALPSEEFALRQLGLDPKKKIFKTQKIK